MVVNYEHGKIYKITSESIGLVYFGSTARYYLSQRLSDHVNKYKGYIKGKTHYVSSFELLKHEDYKIQLIKNFPCANKRQLTTEEGKYIKNNNCVNKYIPGRTRKEYKIQNKEKIKERMKEYCDQNKEKIKEYRDQNKEKKKEQQSKLYNCACGSIVRWGDKARHFKSIKHCEFVNMPQH
tara:strand:+ start:62 stop:601 length:540 start_codon:yes stop_codon:yes gene_type:complete